MPTSKLNITQWAALRKNAVDNFVLSFNETAFMTADEWDAIFEAYKPSPEAVFVVRPSQIDGRGCFTNMAFYEGEMFTVPHKESTTATRFDITLEDGTVVTPLGAACFINHSAEPNAHIHEVSPVGFGVRTLILEFLRDVEPGEEITIHYGEDWDDC